METLTAVRFIIREDGTVESVCIDRYKRDTAGNIYGCSSVADMQVWNPKPQQVK
jgi:hypothetical protein